MERISKGKRVEDVRIAPVEQGGCPALFNGSVVVIPEYFYSIVLR